MAPVVRSSMERSTARLTAGGSETSTTLPPHPAAPKYAMVVLLAEVFDVAAGGFEDPQPQESEHRDEREVASFGRGPRGSRECLELKMAQPQGR
jgi:hypothetical protein